MVRASRLRVSSGARVETVPRCGASGSATMRVWVTCSSRSASCASQINVAALLQTKYSSSTRCCVPRTRRSAARTAAPTLWATSDRTARRGSRSGSASSSPVDRASAATRTARSAGSSGAESRFSSARAVLLRRPEDLVQVGELDRSPSSVIVAVFPVRVAEQRVPRDLIVRWRAPRRSAAGELRRGLVVADAEEDRDGASVRRQCAPST